MFQNAIAAWRNAGLVSAKLSIEQEIGARKTIIVGGWWSFIKLCGNEGIVKPVSTLVAMVTPWNPEERAPAPMPEIPAEFAGTPLGDNLNRAYKQKCDAVIAGAKSAQHLANFDIAGYKMNKSLAAHNAALQNIALPENLSAGSATDAGFGAAIGSIVANMHASVSPDFGNTTLGGLNLPNLHSGVQAIPSPQLGKQA